jgi:hypothetical protein
MIIQSLHFYFFTSSLHADTTRFLHHLLVGRARVPPRRTTWEGAPSPPSSLHTAIPFHTAVNPLIVFDKKANIN